MVTAYPEGVKEFVIYTAMRIGLFVTSLVVVAGVWGLLSGGEVPVLWAVVIAFALSGIASYYLLNRQRDAFARRVEERAGRVSRRYDEMKAREDAD